MVDLSLLQKLAPSDEDLKIIKEKFNADFDGTETGEKLAINFSGNNSCYLPPPGVLLNLLGFRFDLSTIIEKLESVGVKPPAISRSSMYDLQGKGVGKPTYKKYIDWAIDAPLPLLDNLIEGRNPQLDASFKLSSNACLWLASFEGIKCSLKLNNDELRPEYISLIAFIQYRCDTEVAFQQHLRKQGNYSESELSNTDICWKQFVKPFFTNHTVLTFDVLDSMDMIMPNGVIPQGLPESERNTIYKNALRLKFDFILTAIAHYEVGLVISNCPNIQSMRTLKPLICKTILYYSASDEERTCLYWTLQVIKDRWANVDSDISWKKIASYIPINPDPDNTGKGITHEEKQLDRLNCWRKGKNLPSNKLLNQFITNITAEMGYAPDDDSAFILTRISMGLDKALSNLIKRLKKEICSERKVGVIWKDVLSHYYEDYYLHYLNQHIAKIEKTT